MASDLTSQVLHVLSQSHGPVLSADAFPSIPSTTVKSALDRLGSREMVSYRVIDREEVILTVEAEGIAANGSHEAKVFEAVRNSIEGLKIADLPVCWLNCTPARLEVENWLLTVIPETCWERKRRGWEGQSFQSGMDKKRQGYTEGQCETLGQASEPEYATLNVIRQTRSRTRAKNSCK